MKKKTRHNSGIDWKWLLKVCLPLGLIAFALGYFRFPSFEKKVEKSSVSLPEVTVATAECKPFTVISKFPGLVRQEETVQIRPQTEGALLKIHFEDGQLVKQGD